MLTLSLNVPELLNPEKMQVYLGPNHALPTVILPSLACNEH